MAFPFLKNLMVGNPWIWNFSASLLCTVASTFPNFISDPSSFRDFAAFAYSGSRAWQCPHHGASKIQKRGVTHKAI